MSRFAGGTREFEAGRHVRRFKVCIRYREPEYERRTRPRENPFRYTFSITSSSEDNAVQQALLEFRETERQSSVGWGREIVSVDVSEAAPHKA